MPANRPRRERKADRILTPDARAEEIRCDAALAPLDRLARQMDDRWGVDRLVELVSPETAERYGSALAKLNEAIRESDPPTVLHRAKVCIRGLEAMDAEALELGRTPNTGEYWEYEYEDLKFAIVRDNSEWPLVKKERPELQIYSLREIAVILKSVAGISFIDTVKREFPQAEIKKIKERLPDDFWENGGDPIPKPEPDTEDW